MFPNQSTNPPPYLLEIRLLRQEDSNLSIAVFLTNWKGGKRGSNIILMYSFKPENILDKFSEYIHYYLVVHLLFTYCKIAPKPLYGLNHRVGIGQKSPYRESYTVNNY